MANNTSNFFNQTSEVEKQGLCKFYAAGYCYYGSKCYSSHDYQKILDYESKWVDCKTEYPIIQLIPDINNNNNHEMIDFKENENKIVFNPNNNINMALNQLNQLNQLNNDISNTLKKQLFDYCLVLDLEGKDEIIEFPLILIDLKSMKEISRFHRFISPTKWNLQRLIKCHYNNNNNNNKNKMNTNAIKSIINKYHRNDNNHINFKTNSIDWIDAISDMQQWLMDFNINLDQSGKYCPNSKTFITAICGNWDIKTQIPKQCNISNMHLPKYFNQWLNIKDFALNWYQNANPNKITGMKPLLRYLNMKLYGTHHLGMDDTYNIGRIIIRFILDNAVLNVTAKRNPKTQQITYMFNHRIKPNFRRKQ